MSVASQKNRRAWNASAADYQQRHAEQLVRPGWGVWGVPEAELGVLGDVSGRDVLEFGCGGAQWAIRLAKGGARLVGLDGSEMQLGHARREIAEAGVRVPLVQANGERIPFANDRFDVVFCDHGVMSWADPYATVPEAARVLRSGGLFAFNMSTPLHDLCWDAPTEAVGEQLRRTYFGLHELEDEDDSVCFQLAYGEWIRLFRRCGLAVEDLIEIQPPADAKTTYGDYVPLDWARRYPAENVWKLRKE